MAETLKGLGVVWGCGSYTMTGVVINGTVGKMQSFDFNRSAEMASIRDPVGDTVGEAYYDAKAEISLNVIPSDASATSTAITNMLAMLPAPGTAVTVVDADGTDTIIEKASAHAGAYVCVSSSLNRTNAGPASISMQLKRFDAYDISSTIS